MKPAAEKISLRSWYITAPLAALTLGYTLLYYFPGQRLMASQQKEIATMRLEISTAGAVAARIREAERELTELEQYRAAWESRLIREGNLQNTLARITAAVAESGARVSQFSPEPPILQATLRRLPLKLATSGGFLETWEVLQRLDRLPELWWLDRLEIRTSGKNGEMIQTEADMVVFAGSSGNTD